MLTPRKIDFGGFATKTVSQTLQQCEKDSAPARKHHCTKSARFCCYLMRGFTALTSFVGPVLTAPTTYQKYSGDPGCACYTTLVLLRRLGWHLQESITALQRCSVNFSVRGLGLCGGVESRIRLRLTPAPLTNELTSFHLAELHLPPLLDPTGVCSCCIELDAPVDLDDSTHCTIVGATSCNLCMLVAPAAAQSHVCRQIKSENS